MHSYLKHPVWEYKKIKKNTHDNTRVSDKLNSRNMQKYYLKDNYNLYF